MNGIWLRGEGWLIGDFRGGKVGMDAGRAKGGNIWIWEVLGVMCNFDGDDALKDKLFEIAFWDRFSDFFLFCACFRLCLL